MAKEIEAKMKVDDLDIIRQRLKAAGARADGAALEINSFFDTPQAALRASGKGLRIRIATKDDGARKCTITMKGPSEKGELKTREEIEFAITDPAEAQLLFENLGYELTLSFEKRRESWNFQDCKIELDNLPYLGTFVEIEAGSDSLVMQAREALGLAQTPLIQTGYIAMLASYLTAHNIRERRIRLQQ
ncbi:MAG: class IV adenylate cyclase [Planctomycetota bacterium]|nr:class IV adenylate cyclase [Planctomycetota bacterium]